jgi:hypothetical protein
MEFKEVKITESISMPVPKGLSPDEEASFIASRLAFVDLKKLEADCEEAFRLSQEGKLFPLHEVLDELEREMNTESKS